MQDFQNVHAVRVETPNGNELVIAAIGEQDDLGREITRVAYRLYEGTIEVKAYCAGTVGDALSFQVIKRFVDHTVIY